MERIWLDDLGYENWKYPEGVSSVEEKKLFIRSIPHQGILLDVSDYDLFKDRHYYTINNAQELREKAFAKMKEGFEFWMNRKKDACETEKSWLGVCFYWRLIHTEFDIIHACEIRKSDYWWLSDNRLIELWQIAYSFWKVELDTNIKALNSAYLGIDFSQILAKKDLQRKKEWEYLANRVPNKKRTGNCTDGEGEFWRAANNGDLDSIGG